MKKLVLGLLLLLPITVMAQYTPPASQDIYYGDSSLACTNTNTAFAFVTVGTRKVACTPASHQFFSRGSFLLDPTGVTTVDESGGSYDSYNITKFGSRANWVTPTLNQLTQRLGWNTVFAYSASSTFPFNASVKVPYLIYSNTAYYSTMNYNNYGTCAEKDLYWSMGRSGNTTTWGGPAGSGGFRDFHDPCWAAFYTAFLANNDAFTGPAISSLADKKYVLGVADSDSDNMPGIGAGPDFLAGNGNNTFRIGYAAFFVAPVQFVDPHWTNNISGLGMKYTDGTMYLKKKWHDLVIAAHTNISGVNSAWGSSYTTDKTSGTCFGSLQPTYICPSPSAAVTLGTASGSAQTMTSTLSGTVSKFSIYVADNGVVIGGDTGTGTIYGPTIISSGTINYFTGALSVTLTATAGHTITVGYIQNGWGIGTGLLDEDCRIAHSAYCGTGAAAVTVTLTGIPAAVQTDINALTQDYASHYYSTANAAVQNWATTVASPAFVGHVPYFGTVMSATWGAPSDRYVLSGMNGNIDVYLFGASAGFDLTQAKLDFIDTYLPGIPIIDGSYRTANQQSEFSWAVASCTRSGTSATCTTLTPTKWSTLAGNFHIDTSCDNSDFMVSNVPFTSASAATVTFTTTLTTHATATCNVFIDDQGQVNGFATQAARGLDFQTTITNAANLAYTSSGIHPLVGVEWWSAYGQWNEGLDWGYQTVRGNLKDGIENVTPVVACQPPNAAFSCGGELSLHGTPGGDLVTYLQATSMATDAILAGSVPPPPPPPPPTGSVTLTPSTKLFTTTIVAQTISQDFTLWNQTNGNTTITSQTVTGTSFSLDSANSTCFAGMVLNPTGQCTIRVKFTPASATTFSGSLAVVQTTGTLTSTLSGTGITVTPTPRPSKGGKGKGPKWRR
jgi:hypothetical protein